MQSLNCIHTFLYKLIKATFSAAFSLPCLCSSEIPFVGSGRYAGTTGFPRPGGSHLLALTFRQRTQVASHCSSPPYIAEIGHGGRTFMDRIFLPGIMKPPYEPISGLSDANFQSEGLRARVIFLAIHHPLHSISIGLDCRV